MTMFKKTLCIIAILQAQSLIMFTSGKSTLATISLSDVKKAAEFVIEYTSQAETQQPSKDLNTLLIAGETIKNYAKQQLNKKQTDLGQMTFTSITGFGDYQKLTGLADSQGATLFSNNTKKGASVKDIEIRTVQSGTSYPPSYNGKPLIATSANAPGSGTTQLYYGNAVKEEEIVAVTSMAGQTQGEYNPNTNTITLGTDVYTNIETKNYNPSVQGQQGSPPNTMNGKPNIAQSRPAGLMGAPTTYYYGNLKKD